MEAWLKLNDYEIREKYGEPPEPKEDDWEITNPELHWRVWTLVEGLEWNHLPYPGGLLDQPDEVIQALLRIGSRRSKIRKRMKAGMEVLVPRGMPGQRKRLIDEPKKASS